MRAAEWPLKARASLVLGSSAGDPALIREDGGGHLSGEGQPHDAGLLHVGGAAAC